MNGIDDILSDLNITSATEIPHQEEPLSTNDSLSFSDEDISDILESNGVEGTMLENGEPEEEVENTVVEELHDEHQEENNGIDMEQENSNTLDNATPEGNEIINESNESPQETSEETVQIPLNSPTLLMDTSTARFSGTEWYNEIQKARIVLGGCGGIGSNVAFQLARMIPANITIYDDDTVEAVNMAGQLFSYKDIGKSKVGAIADMILQYTSMRQINAIDKKFTDQTEPGDIMICGFDSMRARKTFFKSWLSHIKNKSMEERAKCLLIDGRLSIDTLQVLCIKGDDDYNINRYQREFLFSDSQADETICSMKQTTYLACMIGSLIVNLFTNFIAGTLNPVIPYDLPFFTEYDAQNMIFNTES